MNKTLPFGAPNKAVGFGPANQFVYTLLILSGTILPIPPFEGPEVATPVLGAYPFGKTND